MNQLKALLDGLPYFPKKEDYNALYDYILESGTQEQREIIDKLFIIYNRLKQFKCIHCGGEIVWRHGLHFDHEVRCVEDGNCESYAPDLNLIGDLRDELIKELTKS